MIKTLTFFQFLDLSINDISHFIKSIIKFDVLILWPPHFLNFLKTKVSMFVSFRIKAVIHLITFELDILKAVQVSISQIKDIVLKIQNQSWFELFKVSPITSSQPLNWITCFILFDNWTFKCSLCRFFLPGLCSLLDSRWI